MMSFATGIQMSCSRSALQFWMSILLSLILAACKPEHEESNKKPEAESSHPPVSYIEGKGLLLNDSVRKSIGIMVMIVETRELPHQCTLTFQVFREASEKSPRHTQYCEGLAYACGTLQIHETQNLTIGQTIQIMRFGTEPVSGKIFHVDRAMGSTENEAEVLISIPDKSNQLTLGTFLQASVSLQSITRGLAVPSSAILNATEGTFVYLQNGKYLRRTPVETGSRVNSLIEIRKGLHEGDIVVTKPIQTLWLTELQATRSADK